MRKTAMVLGAVCILLVLRACATPPVVLDDTLSEAESSRLFFYRGLEVTAYYGAPVPSKKILGNSVSTWRDVTLPPGEAKFTLDINWTDGNERFFAKGVLFKYTFDPGIHYSLAFVKTSNNIWGIAIYDQPPFPVAYPEDDNRIAFVPLNRASKLAFIK